MGASIFSVLTLIAFVLQCGFVPLCMNDRPLSMEFGAQS